MRLKLTCFLLLIMVAGSAHAVKFSVRGGDAQAKQNVRVYLQAQNFGPQVSADRIIAASQEKAQEALRAIGYYQGRVTINELSSLISREPSFRVDIEQGAPLLIAKLDIQVLRSESEENAVNHFQDAIDASPMQVDRRFSHGDYEALKSEFNLLAARYGYFDAEFSLARVEVSLVSNRAQVSLHYAAGARYDFGELNIVSQDAHLPHQLFIQMVTFEHGEPFDSAQLAEYNQLLSESDYFRHISVRPELKPDRLAEDSKEVDIEVELKLKAKHLFEVGAGATSDIGPRARLKWTQPWVNAQGHSMSLETEFSRPKQSAGFNYRIPFGHPVNDHVDLQSGFVHESKNDTQSRRWTLSSIRQWRIADIWKPALFIRAQHEQFRQAQQVDASTLVMPGFNISRLRSRGGLNPDWGDNIQVSVEYASPAFGSDVKMSRTSLLTKWLRSWDRHRLISRMELGVLGVDDISQVPASMRYFAGGDQSIRGYDFKTIGPRNAQGQLVGGKYLVTGSLEYNFQFAEHWRLALFADGGTATNDFSETLALGLGMGLRWLTVIGPLRVDVARGVSDGLSDQQQELFAQQGHKPLNNWRLHFSLGADL